MISVEFEHAGVYPVGSEVRGYAVVHGEQHARSQNIKISLGWRTAGRGDTDADTIDSITVPLSGGAGHGRYPFRFVLPKDGPVSYHGHLIRIIWEVEARVEVDWALDPKSRWEITVVPRIVSQPELR